MRDREPSFVGYSPKLSHWLRNPLVLFALSSASLKVLTPPRIISNKFDEAEMPKQS